MNQEETAGSKCNRKKLPTKIDLSKIPENRTRMDKTSFNMTGETKKLFMGQQVLLVLLFVLKSYHFGKLTNAWAWNQWKSAKKTKFV